MSTMQNIETHWTESKNGNGEWLHADLDPQLTRKLSIVGVMIKGGYRYRLLNDGFRKRVEATF